MVISTAEAMGRRSGGTFSTPCAGGEVSISPALLWPPNHKLHSEVVTYSDDSIDGGTLKLTVNGITDNQADDDGSGKGCVNPNQAMDWDFNPDTVSGPEGAISEMVRLRAERCAAVGSREYTINVTCENDPPTDSQEPQVETTDLTVIVPHDQRKR